MISLKPIDIPVMAYVDGTTSSLETLGLMLIAQELLAVCRYRDRGDKVMNEPAHRNASGVQTLPEVGHVIDLGE
ncbi:hypothetical protein N7491_002648 [Penicillium cf. griseofulvum]|nr:hypothetical protein N7491_002648 [Penicillium cf. griseofulvum]